MKFNCTHIRLLATRFADCFRFYRDVMGFPVKHGGESGPYAEFDAGQIVLALFERQGMSEVLGTTSKPVDLAAQDRAMLIFAVEDVDQAYAHLKGKGAALVAEPVDHEDWHIRTAHLRDPDGNLIEINRPL